MSNRLKCFMGIIFILLMPLANAGEIKDAVSKLKVGNFSAEAMIDVFLKTEFYTPVPNGSELSSIKKGNHKSMSFDDKEQDSVIVGEAVDDLEHEYDAGVMSLVKVNGKTLAKIIDKGIMIEVVWLGGSFSFDPEFTDALKNKIK